MTDGALRDNWDFDDDQIPIRVATSDAPEDLLHVEFRQLVLGRDHEYPEVFVNPHLLETTFALEDVVVPVRVTRRNHSREFVFTHP